MRQAIVGPKPCAYDKRFLRDSRNSYGNNIPDSKQCVIKLGMNRMQILFPYLSAACQKSGSRNEEKV
jgi:hypothetical protein